MTSTTLAHFGLDQVPLTSNSWMSAPTGPFTTRPALSNLIHPIVSSIADHDHKTVAAVAAVASCAAGTS
jgi:hypothetical protein